MFNNLRNFQYKRTGEEALGFYLIYTLLMLVALFALGPVMVMSGTLGHTASQVNTTGGVIGCVIGIIYCLGLGTLIHQQKRMQSWQSWALVALAGVAAIIHGIIGMGIIAYMTTCSIYWPRTEADMVEADVAEEEMPEVSVEPEPIIVEEVAVVPERPKSNRLRPDLLSDPPEE